MYGFICAGKEAYAWTTGNGWEVLDGFESILR